MNGDRWRDLDDALARVLGSRPVRVLGWLAVLGWAALILWQLAPVALP